MRAAQTACVEQLDRSGGICVVAHLATWVRANLRGAKCGNGDNDKWQNVLQMAKTPCIE
jgi:hypothetical protein